MTEPSRAVFLSYASEDASAAQRIAEALRAAGIEVWFDQSELRGGDVWDQTIRKQIKACALFIPVISRHTHERREGYFRLEWNLAVDRSRLISATQAFLVPVVIDETREDDEEVPEKIRDVHWTRLPGGETPAAFVQRVQRLVTPDPSSAPAASTRPPPTPGSGPISTTSIRVPRGYKPALWVISAVLGVTLTYFLVDRFWLSKRTAAAAVSAIAPSAIVPDKFIAVLPFVDLSERHDQEYFADGMAEELLDLLTNVPGLKVIGRTSSFQFKGKSQDLRTVGNALGVLPQGA